MQLAAQEKGIPIDWTIINQGGKGTKAMIELYKNPKWFDGFDVVIHNECFADTDDEEYIRSITKPHFEAVNAVVIPREGWDQFAGEPVFFLAGR